MSAGMSSFRFTHAVTRRPADCAVDGLRAVDRGAPDLARLRAQHRAYERALAEAGLEVMSLEPLEEHPDALFVEDVALCLQQGAALLRPGAPSRAAEPFELSDALLELYDDVVGLERGRIDGGDVLTLEGELLVGLSARTDAEGAAALAEAVAPWGWRVRVVATPTGVLHLKTDCALLDAETVLATPRLAASGAFPGLRVVETAPGEDAAANAIRVNDVVIMAAGFAATQARLAAAGYEVVALDLSEAAKLDGGPSCLCLRAAPPPRA